MYFPPIFDRFSSTNLLRIYTVFKTKKRRKFSLKKKFEATPTASSQYKNMLINLWKQIFFSKCIPIANEKRNFLIFWCKKNMFVKIFIFSHWQPCFIKSGFHIQKKKFITSVALLGEWLFPLSVFQPGGCVAWHCCCSCC